LQTKIDIPNQTNLSNKQVRKITRRVFGVFRRKEEGVKTQIFNTFSRKVDLTGAQFDSALEKTRIFSYGAFTEPAVSTLVQEDGRTQVILEMPKSIGPSKFQKLWNVAKIATVSAAGIYAIGLGVVTIVNAAILAPVLGGIGTIALAGYATFKLVKNMVTGWRNKTKESYVKFGAAIETAMNEAVKLVKPVEAAPKKVPVDTIVPEKPGKGGKKKDSGTTVVPSEQKA